MWPRTGQSTGQCASQLRVLSEHIGGVILHWETLFQRDAQGKAIVDIIKDNGMIPGIKVDKGYNKKLGFAGDLLVIFLNFPIGLSHKELGEICW